MLKQKSSWIFSLGLILVSSPAIAHNIKTSGDVAALFHIEPNHNPKAGEPSRAWFALTKQGGELIPLEQCDCKLAVYPDTDSDKSGGSKKADEKKPAPLSQPPLKAISAEKYQGVPGAEVVFPQAGVYTLELSGRPRNGANFEPFTLSYDVTVQAGQPAPQAVVSTAPVAQAPVETSNSNGWIVPAIVGSLGLLGLLGLVKKTNKK